ncbi:MAG TPA: sensor domain-containing diguanylate cyclase [Thermoleophilaceae bacterium]|nr:sensor domain-containing diguanylate cyclase [Thermoleophilaceae bacterium]
MSVQPHELRDPEPPRARQPRSLRAVGHSRERRVAGEREALMRIAAATADAYRLEDVMEQAAEAALAVTGAASLSISRWEPDRQAMRTLINVGELGPGEQRFPTDEVYPLAEHPLVAKLLHDGEPYRTAVDDPAASPPAVAVLKALGKESDVGVPILLDGEVWGEVWAATAPGAARFDADDARFLQAIADRLALVLARGERFARVSRLAYEDPLTGLANRRAVEERLAALLDPEGPSQGPLTLLLADVDGLKDINDARGHHVGDRALCRVGDALVAAAAPEAAALVGRLAGDEFCVLLEGCEVGAANEVARTALELLEGGDDDLPLSLSFGAAEAGAASTPAELLHAADTAQYAAKRRGGGRLCTSGPAADPSTADLGERLQPGAQRLDQQIESIAARTMRILDRDAGHRRVLDRLETVVVGFAAALDAAAWAISRWERGSSLIRSVSTADGRDCRLRGLRMGLANEVYRVEDFPHTAELLRQGHGGFVAHVEDGRTDPAERALLAELGFDAALVAVVAHGSGAYLIEIFADDETAGLAPAGVRLQLLLRLAAAPRSAS